MYSIFESSFKVVLSVKLNCTAVLKNKQTGLGCSEVVWYLPT
jgi:hypothetical protein